MQLNTRDSLFCQGCPPRKLKLTNNPQFSIDTGMSAKSNSGGTRVVTITSNTRQRVSDTKMKSLF